MKERRQQIAMEKLRAFEAARTDEERREILRSMVPVPTVRVASYA